MSTEFNPYQQLIHLGKYSRFDYELGRREMWDETVNRYIKNVVHGKVSPEVEKRLENAILNLEIMPSMRGLMTAGNALERDNTCLYNCAYTPVDNVRVFDETLYILMCGTGVGFSVERQYISQLPEVPENLIEVEDVIVFKDSKRGWAEGYKEYLKYLYKGEIPQYDTSKIRPKGSVLKTFGGQASGPEPLINLLKFTKKTFLEARGHKLNSLQCHDLMCKIGECVVSGGVRRSAMLSLSNLSDGRMRNAKTGNFGELNPQRYLSNNSVAYTESPDAVSFMNEWLELAKSGSGERGIFNREAAERKVQSIGRRKGGYEWGCNPCSEIILRPHQFCNLTEVIVRSEDTIETLKEKVELATILGTIQASYTYFPYLRKSWADNTQEEALLGVSFTGIMDNTFMSVPSQALGEGLKELREVAVETNQKYAKIIGVNPSSAITCVKPSGTVSQLVDSSAGIHPRWSQYYIRRIVGGREEPTTKLLIEQGMPYSDHYSDPNDKVVFEFPMKAPEGAILREDLTAIQQLELWMYYQNYWCEHKPSCTIYVRDHEWVEVGNFVFKHFGDISGVSFLPYDNGIYTQAPYEEITEETYKILLDKVPTSVVWSDIGKYESQDSTTGSQEYACSGGSCEVNFI